MKRFLLAGALSLAGAAALTAQTVTSINAVGYANVTIPAGFSMIANPLNTSANTLNSLLPGSQFGDTIFKWTGTAFSISTYLGSWSPDLSLNPGEGAFIYVGQAQTNTFVGEVLTGSLTNAVPAGFSMRASQVPQQLGLSAMSFPADFGDTVFMWNTTANAGAGGYDIYTFLGTWSPSDPTPKVGQSFWVFKGSSGNWVRNFTISN